MTEELSKVYEPKVTEAQSEQIWSAGNYFHANPPAQGGRDGRSYTIVIPPPNVTAALHLGHALNNALQDILIRFRRMQGFNTLWMPGTDHAGIATQTVVEKRILSEENKRRTDFQREDFVARVQAWKDEYEARIIGQLKAMGCSCDWDRTRFTMDAVCAKAVRETFFRLFADGIIYRGKRLVNWDPVTQTVLADDEVEHETVQGHFWYMRYPLAAPVVIDGRSVEHVTVATTRPETMLGDTAVAMNPADPRAKLLVGKKVVLPIVGRLIPIIADEHVVLPNPESEDEKAKFSTGFLKVTPAHDPDDWEIGQRHNLEIINIMAPDGSISDKYGWNDAKEPEAQMLLGMDRFEAREAVVEWFRQEGLLENIREYTHEVGHSYRSHVPIEPYLSDQWYIAVKKPIEHLSEKFGTGIIDGTDVPINSLAGLALKPLLDGRLKFVPERYAKTYQNWLENLRDWPISRQLWWGHRIPVWQFTLKAKANYSEAVDRLTVFLKKCGVIGKVCTYRKKEDIYTVYVCLESAQDDSILDGLAIYSSQIANIVQPYSPGEILTSRQPIPAQISKNSKEALDFFKNYVAITISRDEDVLDTWFSSALWPFSTLGWPDDNEEMKTYYPGDVLCTAREIITLWVSRMVMMGQYCAGDIPFTDVYIHAMIQDGQGRKMSKSLGNGIDPLVAIDSHGADAMRFTLASMATETQDIRMPVEAMQLPDGRTANTSPKFDIGRNFCNKLWNASRFAMTNLGDIEPEKFDKNNLTVADRWILSRLAKTAAETTKALEQYKFSDPLASLYKFFWNDFCDWYLEWIKPRIRDEQQKAVAQNVLAFVLDQVLRLLHPFVPFITEGIFQKLNEIAPERQLKGLMELNNSKALVIADWPAGLEAFIDDSAEAEVFAIQAPIRAVRDIKNNYNIAPSAKPVTSARAPAATAKILNHNSSLICQLAGLSGFTAGADIEKPANAAAAIVDDIQIYVHDVIDPQAERQRLEKQKEQIENGLKPLQAKLGNENFVSRAKPEVVAQAREKLTQLQEQLETVEMHLAELNN